MIQAHWKRILWGATALGLLAVCILIFAAILWKWAEAVGPASQLTLPFVIVGVVVLVVSFCLVVFACFCVPRAEAVALQTGETKSSTVSGSNWVLKVMVVLGVIVVGSLFTWVGFNMSLREAGPELKLPLIVIIGVVVLLVTLALVAVTFSTLEMQDKTQPLALPEGSVRAVIALMLLLVFAIAAIFLYSNVASSGKIQMVRDQSFEALQQWKKHVSILSTDPAEPAAGVAPPADQKYAVYYREPGSPAADDLAKQLVVLLGTLVTAVASFYFGSSSVASARDAAEKSRGGAAPGGAAPSGASPAPPNPEKVDLTNLQIGVAAKLTITGSGLAKVNKVELKSADGSKTVQATSISPEDGKVECSVTVPTGSPTGSYDTTVSDGTTTVPVKGAKITVAL